MSNLATRLPDLRATAYGGERFESLGPYKVGRVQFRLEDRSRPTPPNRRFPGLPYRRLNTSVWYPAESRFRIFRRGVAEGGAFPLVVYSHGFASSRAEATRMAPHFASHGIIVVAADFPLSRTRAHGGRPTLLDVKNQALDVSFLLKQMLKRNQHPMSPFHGTIDPERIGAAGISLGATTTLLATYHKELQNAHIRAAVSIAGPTSMFGDGFFSRDVPLLHVHGERDAVVYYNYNARPLLERTGPWAQLLTIEGASHTGFAHIPLEAFSLKFFGAVVAPQGAHPGHADRLGCGVVLRALPEELTFLQALPDLEHGIQPPDETRPGDLAILSTPAVPPDYQRRIAINSALAFFLSHFANKPRERDEARRFLEHTLMAREGVRLEEGRRPILPAHAS